MGLDGFSISQIKQHKDLTSAQMANNAETAAMKGSQRIIKHINNIDEKQKTKNKEFEQEDELPVYYFEKDDENASEDDEYAYDEDRHNEEYQPNGNPKKYTVKLNNKTQLIELIDTERNVIVETISPNDLIKLVSKLNSTSGILVNRKI